MNDLSKNATPIAMGLFAVIAASLALSDLKKVRDPELAFWWLVLSSKLYDLSKEMQ